MIIKTTRSKSCIWCEPICFEFNKTRVNSSAGLALLVLRNYVAYLSIRVVTIVGCKFLYDFFPLVVGTMCVVFGKYYPTTAVYACVFVFFRQLELHNILKPICADIYCTCVYL